VKDKVLIRGKAAHCALGDDIGAIVTAMREQRVSLSDMPLTLINMDYSRPYFRLAANDASVSTDMETRFYDVLYRVIEKAIRDAGLSSQETERMAIFFGSTSIDIPIYEEHYRNAQHVLSQSSSGYGNIASEIIKRFHTGAASYTFTTACTSSANAFLYAATMISQGFIERALVVGYDLFSHIGFCGFEALKLITAPPYRPFDKNRQGIIMGEGCGAVVLDKTGASPDDFYFLGGANACDTHSVTTHDPQGAAIAKVMRAALVQAGVDAQAIEAVKAHATGSYHNDLTECNGLKQVFGSQIPPVTGLKPFIGHTVGACGVIEMILFSEAIKAGFIPPTLGYEIHDEELAVTPLTQVLAIKNGTFLLNYFGFGGNCVSLVIANQKSFGNP
jgi:3-oxoacyl-[acyl-carrier-protein] synthase-1